MPQSSEQVANGCLSTPATLTCSQQLRTILNDKPKGIEPLEPSAADNLKTLVQECGVSPHKIPEILQELPPLRTSDALINYYFREMYVLLRFYPARCLNPYSHLEIGPDMPYRRRIFEQRMHQSVLMVPMVSVLPTRTMSDSFLFSLWF